MNSKQINKVMLIDDNEADNFLHKIIIEESNLAHSISIANDAYEAIDIIKESNTDSVDSPDLIFLDINMPGINGWEFLDQISDILPQLSPQPIIIMLSTSQNPEDINRADQHPKIQEFHNKPLSSEILEHISQTYFKG